MYPGIIEGANLVLKKPENMEDCLGLHVLATDHALISAWFPTPEELACLNKGEPVYLFVHSATHPPISLGVRKS